MGSLRQEVGILRNENMNQNVEISLLKEMIESQDKKIAELDQRMTNDKPSVVGNHNQHSSGKTRQK